MKHKAEMTALMATAVMLAGTARAQVLAPDGTLRNPGVNRPAAGVANTPAVPAEPGASSAAGGNAQGTSPAPFPAAVATPVPAPVGVKPAPRAVAPARSVGAPAEFGSDEIIVVGGPVSTAPARAGAKTPVKTAPQKTAVAGKPAIGRPAAHSASAKEGPVSADLARFRAEGARQIAACYGAAAKATVAGDVYGAVAYIAPDFLHYNSNGQVTGRQEFINSFQQALRTGIRFTSYRYNILRIIWHDRDAEVWVKEDFKLAGQNTRAQLQGNAGAYSREFWSLTRAGWKMRQSVVANEGHYMNFTVSPR